MFTFITVSPTDIRKTCSKFTFKIFHLEKSNYFQLFRIEPSGHISSRVFLHSAKGDCISFCDTELAQGNYCTVNIYSHLLCIKKHFMIAGFNPYFWLNFYLVFYCSLYAISENL